MTTTTRSGGDWDEHKLLIVDALERLERAASEHEDRDERRFSEMNAGLGTIRQDIAALKVRSGVWGAIAGGIPALAVLIIVYLESRGP